MQWKMLPTEGSGQQRQVMSAGVGQWGGSVALKKKHKEHNLSPFTVIFDNTERTQHRPRYGKGAYRTGTRADGL